MMTKLFLILGILFSTTLKAQQNTSIITTNETVKKTVHIEGLIVGVYNADVFILNQNINQGRQPIATFKTDEKGGFKFDFELPFSDYFYLRIPNGQGLTLALSGNENIKIYADSKSLLYNCNIIGSKPTDDMLKFYQTYVPFKQFEDSLRNILNKDKTKQKEVNAAFQTRAQGFYAQRNKFIQEQTNTMALIAAIPAINEETEFELYKQVVEKLAQSNPKSPTAQALNNQLKSKIQQNIAKQKIAPGKPAPEIIVEGVDGKTIKLSDLKGKVVLIDMWASWCGPCRKENPNVVKAYEKYHKDGFEVFSVSFDKPGNKERWIAAIKQDGLIWPNHGSELNGFNNQAARDYSVRGIPFTCLIDADGNIIKTNLRGAALEIELKKIFGH